MVNGRAKRTQKRRRKIKKQSGTRNRERLKEGTMKQRRKEEQNF
jgi:hypothetical protein